MDHKSVKAVVFDLDGTLYLSGRPYPGAVEAVKRVASRVPVYYLSNNTSKSPVFYENRLKVMGLPLRDDSIISALYLSLDAIHEKGIKNVYFFANPEVYEWFAAQDPSLNLNPSVEDTELVLVAYHNSFDYRELCELSFRVQRGIPFWVTHTDFVCPDANGPVPDIGSFMALLPLYGLRTREARRLQVRAPAMRRDQARRCKKTRDQARVYRRKRQGY